MQLASDGAKRLKGLRTGNTSLRNKTTTRPGKLPTIFKIEFVEALTSGQMLRLAIKIAGRRSSSVKVKDGLFDCFNLTAKAFTKN